MDIELSRLPKSEAKLTITLDPSDYDADLKAAAVHIAAERSFPGFRPGKAPYDLVVSTVGEAAVLEAALERIVRRTFTLAVKQHELTTIGQPEVKAEKVAPGNPLVYTATVALLPLVALPDLHSVSAQRKQAALTEADVEAALQDLRKMVSTDQDVDRPAQLGDRVEVDFDVFVDNVAIEGGKSRKHPLTLGEHAFIPGFEEQVVGMTKGQTKEFPLPFPKDYHAKRLAGKQAEFRVTPQRIAEVKLPEVNDAFAKQVAGMDTVMLLRDQLRKDLGENRRKREEQEYEVALLDDLVKRTKFGDIPDVLVESEVKRMEAELRHDVERRGMKFDDYVAALKKDLSAFRRDLRPNAERRAKTALAIRTIAQERTLAPSPDAIAKETATITASVPEQQNTTIDPQDVREFATTVLINRMVIDELKRSVKPAL